MVKSLHNGVIIKWLLNNESDVYDEISSVVVEDTLLCLLVVVVVLVVDVETFWLCLGNQGDSSLCCWLLLIWWVNVLLCSLDERDEVDLTNVDAFSPLSSLFNSLGTSGVDDFI